MAAELPAFAPGESLKVFLESNSTKCPFDFIAYFPEIPNPFQMVYHLIIWDDVLTPPPPYLWDLCFAARGDIFILFFVFSVIIFAISVYAVYVCFQSSAAGTTHRKTLFLCLLGASVVRLIYSCISLQKIITVKTMSDVAERSEFFVKTLVPVMAFSDWFTGLVDVAMAFFWYTIQSNRESFPTDWFVLCSMGSAKILIMIMAHDVDYVSQNLSSQPDIFFNALLWFIAIIVLVGAISHIVVALAVIRTALRTSSSVVYWQRFRALWPMFVIVFVTATSGIVRAGILIGRQTGIPIFFSGIFSFNNPQFTTTYFILIMQIPPLIVAFIAATLTAKSAKDALRQQEEAAQLILDRGSGYGATVGNGTIGGESTDDVTQHHRDTNAVFTMDRNYSGRNIHQQQQDNDDTDNM